jgi:cysteine-rich repeat protein
VTIPDPPIDGTNGRYSSPSLAFSSNSTVFKFTLEQQETCTFFMRDGAGQYIDNVGGVSLRLVAPSICTEHVQCDDSNGCTEDLCNVATGSCFYERANEEGTCNEGAGVCRDGECVTVLPNLADLELLTGCRPIPPCPDGAVRCDIHALNFGPGPAQELSAVMDLTNDLQVSPPVDSLAIFRGFNSTGSIGHGATPSVTPQRVEWTAPSIPAGGKAATWFTLDVGQAGGDKVVSVASGTPDPNLGNNNHIQTILPDAGRCPATDYVDKVGITARGGNQVCTNESIFYMIVFQHPPASIADVVDALDPCLDPATVSALMPEQECRVTGSTVTCAGIALDAAGMGQVSFAVKPRLSCPVGTTIPNEVVVTFDNGTELRDRTVHELGCGTGPCGNGIVEPDLEEQCEPPGTATCDAACVLTCGNGVTEPELGEECDDGNNDDDDRCSALCKLENERPVCTNAFATPDALWPPNHRLVPISVAGVADPDGDPVSITVLSVHQDEPVNGLGDGSTSPDGGGVGTDTALVRGERAGNPNVPGDGRVYTIRFDADDSKGGVCEGAVTVCVPHDQRTGSECIDGGPIFDSALW